VSSISGDFDEETTVSGSSLQFPLWRRAHPAALREAGQGASDAAKGGSITSCGDIVAVRTATEIADAYFSRCAVPGLNRLGISPVGVFTVDIGPESPTFMCSCPAHRWRLCDGGIPSGARRGLLKAGAPFLNAPAKEHAYVRIEVLDASL